MIKEKEQIRPLLMRGLITPDTLDVEKRTIQVTFGTETPILMRNWSMSDSGLFYEILSFDPTHVRMERLNNGAPVCDNHDRSSVKTQLGVVDKGWVQDKTGLATLRFSKRDDVEKVFQDIQDAILQNVSVGYRVYKYELVVTGDAEIPTYRAIDWEPYEITMAVVPADYNAGVRSDQPDQTNEVQFINNNPKIRKMKDENGNEITPGTPEVIDTNKVRSDAAAEERTRVQEITLAVRKAGITDETFLDDLITKGTTADAARALIIEKFAEGDPGKGTRNQVTMQEQADVAAVERSAMELMVCERTMPGSIATHEDKKVADMTRNFRSHTLMDMARTLVERTGAKTVGWSRDEVLARALSTSDFPNLLGAVVNKILLKGYQAPPQTWRKIATYIPAPDFKTMTAVKFGGNIKLEEVKEHGEFKNAKLADSAETWKVKTYGKIIPITRQSIINDDLSGFSRLANFIGMSAANLESDIMWGLITANGTMADGKALFHADHKNLATSACAPDLTALSAGRAKLRKQTGLDGELLNLMIKYIIVPPDLETTADQLTSPLYLAATQGNINPFQGRMEVISDARLTDTYAWYLAADPSMIDQLVFSYLQEDGGAMFTETRFGFDVDGIQVKVRKDFGGAVIEHRGLYKNAGH